MPDADPVALAPVAAPTAGAWSSLLFSRWTLIALILLGIAALVVRPRRRLDDEEAASFAELLKAATAERELTDAR